MNKIRFGAAARALTLVAGLAASSLAASLAACGPHKGADDAAAPMFTDQGGLISVPDASPLRDQLQVAAVGGGAGATRLVEPAQVEADPSHTVNILTPLTGRVEALKVSLGQSVRRGQVLAVIASGDFAQAAADTAKAKDALDLDNKALDRASGVHAAGGAADKDLEAAQSAYNQALYELQRARTREASLTGAPGQGRLVLTAPQSGVITALAIAPGAQVSDPTATLMTIANIDRVFVTADLAEGEAGEVADGEAADISLSAYPGQVLHGRVASIDALLQPDTRRRKARILLDNPGGRLLPNMYGQVTFSAPAHGAAAQAVTVPQSALLMNNDAITVMVEVRPWVFQREPVQLGDQDDDTAQVIGGLKPGDRIVVKGGVLLND